MISWICSLLWTESICLKSIHAVSFAENAFRFRFILNSKMWPPYFKKVVSMVWKGCRDWRVFILIVNVVTTCDMTLLTVSGKTSIWHTLHYVDITRRPPPATPPASIWPLIGPHWSWMSACPPRVIHSVLVTGTKPGLYLTWFESLIPGQGRRYFSSQPGLMVQNHSFKVHFTRREWQVL